MDLHHLVTRKWNSNISSDNYGMDDSAIYQGTHNVVVNSRTQQLVIHKNKHYSCTWVAPSTSGPHCSCFDCCSYSYTHGYGQHHHFCLLYSVYTNSNIQYITIGINGRWAYTIFGVYCIFFLLTDISFINQALNIDILLYFYVCYNAF